MSNGKRLTSREKEMIETLWKKGGTYNSIATLVGVSRSAVGCVIRGMKDGETNNFIRDDTDKFDFTSHLKHRREERWAYSPDLSIPNPDAPYEWCSVCRANVQKPCLACQIRDIAAKRRLEGTLGPILDDGPDSIDEEEDYRKALALSQKGYDDEEENIEDAP